MTLIAEGSCEWFQARAGIATASVLKEIMSADRGGKKPGAAFWTAVFQKVHEKASGQIRSGGTGPAAQRGVDLEPMALQAYSEMQGVTVIKPGLLLHPRLAFGASPDGIVWLDGKVQRCVEVKCPNDGGKVARIRITGDVEEYADQCHGQMLVTGAQWVDLVLFDPDLPPDLSLTIIKIVRDEERLAAIEARIELFTLEVNQQLSKFQGEA